MNIALSNCVTQNEISVKLLFVEAGLRITRGFEYGLLLHLRTFDKHMLIFDWKPGVQKSLKDQLL